ncbi:glutaredoxin family protein [Candidatus Saccharibacteria bacterium]|nr:glutaredoxin family protein [Candidatus Saccharibacteria bacterium]
MTTLYSSPDCAYCHMVREYLKKKKVHFKEYDISDNPKAFNWVKENAPVIATPVVDIDGKIIVGFDRQKIDAALAR